VLGGFLVIALLPGCPQSNVPVGGRPQAGDVLRPRLHLPEGWVAGKRTAFGAYVEVNRPGLDEPFDLKDEDVPEGSLSVVGTLTFFAGNSPLAEPSSLKFVHEC
jgi:hypothetical protein